MASDEYAPSSFSWRNVLVLLFIALVVVGLLFYLVYEVRLAAARTPYLSPLDPSGEPHGGITNVPANLRVFSDKGVDTRFNADMPPLADIEPGSASIPRTFLDGTQNTIFFASKYGHCGEGGSRYTSEPTSPFAPFFGQNAAQSLPHPQDLTAAYQLHPDERQCRTTPLIGQSFTTSGMDASMGDGSVRPISPRVTARTWNLLVQPNDGLEVPDDWH